MLFEQFSNVTQACLAGLGVALDAGIPDRARTRHRPPGPRLRLGGRPARTPIIIVRPRHRLDFQPARIFADWLADRTAEFAKTG
jgi:LysR family glycine cleavage system transcriptional activator